jgi:methanogenic corrinoid protein MtbC1
MDIQETLKQLSVCVEKGKADKNASYPPDMKGLDGAAELTRILLDSGVSPNTILQDAFMAGMKRIGEKFSQGKAFVPQLLLAAKAMNAAMVHLEPFFKSGEASYKGNFILGTVAGDLHDIGKNIVKLVLEGDGWKVIDLGVDVPTQKFMDAINQHPGCIVGMSALLTTTMVSMEESVKFIKSQLPDIKIFVGGAPLNNEFNDMIGADGYFADPYKFVQHISVQV